jgi:hypothetical protein
MSIAESSSRSKKKKWSKGKVKEQLNNAVFFEAEGYKKMEKEIPKTKVRPLVHFLEIPLSPMPHSLYFCFILWPHPVLFSDDFCLYYQ